MQEIITISGTGSSGERLESRVLEETIQQAVEKGERKFVIRANGQHGIGGRLWKAGEETVYLRVEGAPGQRLGSFGYPNTEIEVMGPASDDTGWLNAGADITIHGHATNGTCNAMAQGRVRVKGSIGSRGMTMTKANPRFAPPELWVLGSCGDYFGEFMAGGIAVVCGHQGKNPDSVLGYRPLVGMVGGRVFFRGPIDGFSETDAMEIPVTDADWKWLSENLGLYLEKIGLPDLFDELANRRDWRLIRARGPKEKRVGTRKSMKAFRAEVWNAELGEGGLIGDLTDLDMSPIGLVTTGNLRRFVPVWENRKYKAPCQGACPSGIPVQERWQLVREGRIEEAVDMALCFTPFPATVCGHLCPNPCMSACTRHDGQMVPIDVRALGKASIEANAPEFPEIDPGKGKKVAIIGGGPAGISVAWQLRMHGHDPVLIALKGTLGGKIRSVIPESRIPEEVLSAELARIGEHLEIREVETPLKALDVMALKERHDYVVLAGGARRPRRLDIPGGEFQVPSLDFLELAKKGAIQPGRHVVVIGGGNVGCDVATEARRIGAESVTILDVRTPAAFGIEKEEAEKAGAIFRWPCAIEALERDAVVLATGERIAADLVVTAIGDEIDGELFPDTVRVDGNRPVVDAVFRTTDEKIFAIGDLLGPRTHHRCHRCRTGGGLGRPGSGRRKDAGGRFPQRHRSKPGLPCLFRSGKGTHGRA